MGSYELTYTSPNCISAAPNDGFLPNALKRYFRLSGVLLKLCRLIFGCAIKSVGFYLFGHSRGTVVFPNLLGLFCPFPENLRSYCLSENPS